MTNRKILPVALVAALLGGTVGAFVMRPGKTTDAAVNQSVPAAATQSSLDNSSAVNDQALPVASKNEIAANGENNLTPDERDAYRDGFTDGAKALRENGAATVDATRYAVQPAATSRVASRTATRTRYANSGSSSQRRVYYDYSQPRQRSFWQKHRDKLTLAAGTGGGALLGGLIGGKKGAAIGAITGGGGSALYTYKLRKRNRRY